MPYGSDTQAAEGFVEKAGARDKVYCPACGGDRARRTERKGFLQKRVYSFFGYYPWHCPACKHAFLLRKRYRRKSKPKEYLEK